MKKLTTFSEANKQTAGTAEQGGAGMALDPHF